MKNFFLQFTLLLLVSLNSFGQSEEEEKKIVEATDFSVPSAPAFILLDATPAQINKPAFAKDFKFDWVFKDNKLAPNIAMEIQPVWMLFYKKTSLTEYQSQDWLPRQLSTLSFSLGTAKKDSVQSLAWAFRVNLFRARKADPMLDTNYINSLREIIADSEYEKKINIEIESVKAMIDANEDPAKKEKLIKRLDELKQILEREDDRKKNKYKEKKKEYQEQNWNATLVDIGFGKSYNYFGEELDELKFESRKSGIWINGCYNFGTSNFLVSGLYKYLGGDTTTNYAGINLRYGSSRVNFFAEFVFEKNGNEKRRNIAYGGDFRLNDLVMIQFGLRTVYDKSFTLRSLKPIVNLNWLLKKN